MDIQKMADTPTVVMLARVCRGLGAHDASQDEQILAEARETAQETLLDSELWSADLAEQGWEEPSYLGEQTLRLLYLTRDLGKLMHAVQLAQAIRVHHGAYPRPIAADQEAA